MSAGAACVAQTALAKEPAIAFPTDPRSRISVASYPFREEIKQSLPLTAFPAMVASRFRVNRIEPLSDHFPTTDALYLNQFNTALRKAAVKVVNIPVSMKSSLYDPDEAKRQAAIAEARRWVDIAVAIGSPSVRIHIKPVKNVKPDIARTVASLKKVAAYGRERDIVINLENDDPASEDAAFIVPVLKQAGDSYLRALPDFCNSMLTGNETQNYEAVRAMFQHAYNIAHVKDSEADNGKVYRIDIDRTFAIAKQSGYRGYFSMEWEGEGEPYAGTQKLIDATLKNLAG